MELLRVAGATLNQTPLDFAGNKARIATILAEARRQGVELLVLPELAISGYGCEDAFFSMNTAVRSEAALTALLPETRGLTAAIGLPHFYYGAMYNCVALVQDGKILGVNAKRVLPREGVHYEPRWFRPWPFGKVTETLLSGVRVPFGDIRYRLGPLGVAIEICEEAWDSVPASASHADAVDLVLNPSASHFALGKYQKRVHLVANSSRSLQVIYVYTNLVGLEAGRMIYDGGVLFAAGGEVVERGPRFGFGDGRLTYLDVNPELARLAKLKAKPVREPQRDPQDDIPLGKVEIDGKDPRRVTRASSDHPKSINRTAHAAYRELSREQEFLEAEMLGLFDYARKTHSCGYVVSLSGGCDSAACAVLVGHMLAAASKELGLGAAATRLGIPVEGKKPKTPFDLTKKFLTTLYQSTANSGDVTRRAARGVAEAIGATHHEVDVDHLVKANVEAAARALGRALTWEQDDVALQNVQARTRGPIAWLLANVERKVLLTTSNRSEAAVGYATMDGDTAGGLAPLGGIDKPFLRSWLRWAEERCEDGLGKIAPLALVNAQAPTAELRPGKTQTDEEDLMPYVVLERIERYFVRDRLGVDDVLAMLAFDFPEIKPETRRAHAQKFFRLWAQSQWKRERFAPSFHLDDESLDPKTWCRYPILSAPWDQPSG